MTKTQKLRMQSRIAIGVLCLVVVIGVGISVKAFQSNEAPQRVIENVEIYNEAPSMDDNLGAVSSPDFYGDFRVFGKFMQGGAILASSTPAATGVLTAAQLREYKQLDYTLTSAANTLTLAATSTMTGILPYAGNCMDFKIRNVSPTAASSTTIAAGTGMDLVENENGDVVIEGGNEARITFCRELDTDITVSVDEYIAAD